MTLQDIPSERKILCNPPVSTVDINQVDEMEQRKISESRGVFF